MLFGPVGRETIPFLIKGYPRLAATILAPHLATASVLWVGETPALAAFNDWLLSLAMNSTKALSGYVDWLWPRSCCFPAERGGMFPDASGNGIRPYSVNEMSMMGYYHELNSSELEYLPMFPQGTRVLNKKHMNVTEFTPGGREVGPSTGVGMWDSGSYGQYIGGTPRFRGRNKGFIDFGHVIGQGIIRAGCLPKFMCGNTSGEVGVCRMAPYVRCGDINSVWSPINNLHVHCKLTTQFRNVVCPCREIMPYSAQDEEDERQKQIAISEELAKTGNKTVPITHLSAPAPLPSAAVPASVSALASTLASATSLLSSSLSSHSSSTSTSASASRTHRSTEDSTPEYIPIVYFYIINENQCASGLPLYLKDAVAQAVQTQSSQVFLISTFSKCKAKGGHDLSAGYPASAVMIDYHELQSEKTKNFITTSVNILGSDGLWYV